MIQVLRLLEVEWAGVLRGLCVGMMALGACGQPVHAQVTTPLSATHGRAIDADLRTNSVAQTVLGILSYVRWPADVTDVTMCIVGPTEYADELTRTQSFTLPGGRQVHVRRHALADGLPACAVVYIGVLDDPGWRKLFRQLAGRPVLSIGERREQCQAGGMFCLDVRQREMSFEVNLDSVVRSGVRIHPHVLQLAQRKARQP